MKRNFVFIFALAALMTAFSCSKEPDTPQPEPTPETHTSGYYFRKEGLQAHYDTLLINKNVAYLGGAKTEDESWIRARSAEHSVSDPNLAEVLILGESKLSSYESVINNAYKNGKIIVFCSPSLAKLKALQEKYGWTFILPSEAPKERDYAICAFKNHTYVLMAPVHFVTTSKSSGSDHPDVKYLKGEEKYENKSIFSHGRGLVQFIDDANTSQTKASIAAGSLSSESNTYNYYVDKSDYFCQTLSCHGGGDRYFRFFCSYRISYSIYPCHVHQNSEGNGTDYYTISAVASNYAPTAYEYTTDSTVSVSGNARYWTGKGDKSCWGDCQYMGPYNTQMTFNSHAKNATVLAFSPDGIPIPGTQVDVKDYSQSQGFSWSAGVSGGKTGDKNTCSFNLGIGGSKTNSVSYSVSDLSVVNDHDANLAKYEYNYGNIPKKDDDFDNFVMPSIAYHTGDFQMSWQWTAQMNDGDTSIIPLVTEVSQTISMWARDKIDGLWKNDLFTYSRSSTDTNNDAMYVAREPIGCLRINNQSTNGNILYDIVIVDETGQSVYSENQNSICQGEFIEVLLPQRNKTYGVSLNMGTSRTSTVPYYSTDQAYTLDPMDDATTKRILTINENGADFSSNVGVLRVKNQSADKLIMNLTVRTADSTAVYQWPNSIGNNETAEMKLTAGKEYYVTMNYGSSSSYEAYKSAQSFTLSSFKSESDVKILTATDSGGDFIKVQ